MTSNPGLWKYNLIWEKTQPTGFLNAHKMPLRCHEDICVFYKHPPAYNPQKTSGHKRKVSTVEHGRNCVQSTNYGTAERVSYDSTDRFPRSVLVFPKDTQTSSLHPTQKPVALCEYLIKTYTDPGGVVLDNCMGSGTTGVACVNTGRSFLGIEIEDAYYQTACARIKHAVEGE